MEVYTLSRSKKILAYVLFGIMILASLALAVSPLFDPSFKSVAIVVTPMSLVATGLLIGSLLQIDEMVIVDRYSIRKVSRLVNRVILLNDIKGYRLDGPYLRIIPNNGKKISISISYEGFAKLQKRMLKHYRDLNKEGRDTFDDGLTGKSTRTEIDKRLKQAKRESLTLTGITTVLCVLTILDARYTKFDWISLPTFCCILFSLYMMYRHKGFISIDGQDRALPNMMYVPLMVAVALYVSTMDMQLLDKGYGWLPAAGICMILIFFFWRCARHLNLKTVGNIICGIMVIGAFYGSSYFLILIGNRMFDRNEATYFEATVINKRTDGSSDGKICYLTLSPWAHQPLVESVRVPIDFYKTVVVNKPIGIYFHQGAFNIRWFKVDTKRE